MSYPGLASYIKSHRPLIQVAFDVTSLAEALRVARSLVLNAGTIPFIAEAGTPLLKSEGMYAVEVLSSATGRPVLADTKTVDAGDVEAELVASHGGAAMTLLALAPEDSLKRATRRAHELGLAVVVDLLGVKDVERGVERANDVEADVVLLHVGVDVQRERGIRASSLLEEVEKARELFSGFIAVAGGIKPEEVPLFARRGADVIVMGSSIIKSTEPGKTLLKAYEALGSLRPSSMTRYEGKRV